MAHGFEARRLLRSAREATLATSGPEGPHAALVTPATTPGLDIVLLLSGLSRHTRELARDGRCALLVTGPAVGANPQARPRLSVACAARPETDPLETARLRDRFLAIHPYASLYAGLGDFRLWRLTPTDSLLVAGFGRAVRIGVSDLLAPTRPQAPGEDPEDVARARRALGREDVVAIDLDGVDVADGEATRRIGFPEPLGRVDELGAGWLDEARTGLPGS